MQISKLKIKNLERFYPIYKKKNSILQKYGFPVLELDEFENMKDSIYSLKNKNKEILFFVKDKQGFSDSRNYILSHLCVMNNVDESLSEEVKICFKGWMVKEDIESLSFLIDDYLSEENSFARRLSLIREHFTTRLINRDIEKTPISTKESLGNITDFQIRPFEVGKDEDNFIRIFNETFSHLCKPISMKEINQWENSAKFCSGCYLFAQINSEIIGFIAIEIGPKKESGNKFSYLQEIGVKEKFRGRGIGTILMKAGLRAAVAVGSNRMGVGVLDSNERALTFFKKEGFIEVYKKVYWEFQ